MISDQDPTNLDFLIRRLKKKQTSNDRLDESLGERRGAESTKTQSYASRRDESRGASKA